MSGAVRPLRAPILLAAAFAVATATAGCGRKGALDVPAGGEAFPHIYPAISYPFPYISMPEPAGTAAPQGTTPKAGSFTASGAYVDPSASATPPMGGLISPYATLPGQVSTMPNAVGLPGQTATPNVVTPMPASGSPGGLP